ncbi:hypothetical protein GCM10023322_33270 [Rugosimonospora acidiphila]|uniref:tRNA nuclease CdiA C-terminal domain-containing protein n=1 Tax=Rugosimonospora acidiphila TaxID=556531 RepID=A0ABP9RU67_9ACTN
MSGNRFGAVSDDDIDPRAGIWIAEDIDSICTSVKNGSWVDGSLGALGAGLDGLVLVSDPVGVLLQYGVAWIIEHVRPLTETLNWLAGDPAQITANTLTWRNIAGQLRQQSEAVAGDVRLDLSAWVGQASDAYRARSRQQQGALIGLATAADTMAAVTEGTGVLIATVRLLVRDAIAMCVSRLIVYAAEEGASLGLATPLVIEQVTATVAACAARISRYLKALLASLRRLMPIIGKLEELIAKLNKLFSVRHGESPGGPHEPHEPRPGDPGFDPAMQHGALGDHFEPGVHDPGNEFLPKERAIADRLAQNGEQVNQRPADHTVPGQPNPDAMVRTGPDDPGTITEFKTLAGKDGSNSVRRNILDAGGQVPDGGGVVLDGRATNVDEADAIRGHARALGQAAQTGQKLPTIVRIILGDGRIITLP